MISGIVFWRAQQWQAGNNFGLHVTSISSKNAHSQFTCPTTIIYYIILLRIIPPLLVTSCYIPFYDQYDPFNDQCVRSQLDLFANFHIIWVWYGQNWEPQNPLVPKIWGSPLFKMAIGVSS